jgi:hypothetical protein
VGIIVIQGEIMAFMGGEGGGGGSDMTACMPPISIMALYKTHQYSLPYKFIFVVFVVQKKTTTHYYKVTKNYDPMEVTLYMVACVHAHMQPLAYYIYPSNHGDPLPNPSEHQILLALSIIGDDFLILQST